MKRVLRKCVIVAVLLAGFAAAADRGFAQEAYRVGVSLGLSGVAGALTQREIKAVELATDIINAKGGVNGRPLKLIIEDDQSKPELAVAKAHKLIEQDHVLAILGGNTGDTAMAIGAIAERKEVPLLSPTGYNGTEAQKNYKYSFLMIPDYDDAVESLVKYSVDKLGCRKIGLLRLTRLWGVQASNAYKVMTQKYGASIAREELMADTDKDLTPQLTNINAAEPCAIAIWASVPAAAIAIKNARQLGIAVPLLGNPIFAAASTPEIAGSAAEGVIATATLVSEDPLPRQRDYVERFREKYHLAADMWDAATFDAINVLAQAIAKLPVEKVSAQSVREALSTTSHYEGAEAVIDFTRSHWPLSQSWILITIRGGKAVRLSSG